MNNNKHVQANVGTRQPTMYTERIKRRVIKIAKCTENRLAFAFHLFVFHKDKVLFLRRILGDALPVAIDTDTEAPRDDSLR